ncbi:hypothetical protein PV327_002835 [Microctonus hyperodae]|uniref:Alpha-carbonic anhydrase domain-containing protein n=1 Tax=Microctonus hyperodae TaxID=165561 RepID=A0AA39KPL6_MICHY|nr:hypothetical protein PV327_002835 [Microctonus hyperodae]
MDLTLSEVLIVSGSLILIGLLVSEILDWLQMLIPLTSNNQVFIPLPVFDYANDNQPHDWKAEFIRRVRSNQSPINIITNDSVVIEGGDPLDWIDYSTQPEVMTMINDGNTITLHFVWPNGIIPHIEKGPLRYSYNFHSIIFYWGISDDVGSEHGLDNVKYPMEMQLVHVKANLESPRTIITTENSDEIAIISYFFKISKDNNDALDNITSKLSNVEDVQSKIFIEPFNIDTLFPIFKRKFYTFNGSSTALSFSENVTWIINPEPLNIARTQMEKFRKINLLKREEIKKYQPIQTFNQETVYFHE